MSELRDLYQEVILDHSRKPRGFGAPEGGASVAHGHNPLCGDQLTIYVQRDGDAIRAVRFEGKGCAISTASASLLTEAVRGLSCTEAEALFERFHEVVTSEIDADVDLEAIGKLAVLAGVRDYPMRVKCASLAWHTFRAALREAPEAVTTE